ncbi:dihydrofolate reductase family protein, partial [bacterium]|nr:dihydrofolate reductase family protein [bacterium]
EKEGAKVLIIKDRDKKVDLKELLKRLGELEITSLLVEGGGRINASFLENGLVDKVLFFIAPKIIGGKEALTPVEGEGIKRIKDAIKLRNISVRRFGEDVLVEGYI